MAQKICVLSLCLLFGFNLQAQKVKNENFYVYYNRMPDNPMPKEYTTYSASVKSRTDILTTNGLTESALIKKHLNLRGIKRLPKGGHFHVNVEVGRFRVESVSTETTETKTKNKEGVEKTVRQYHKKVVYQLPVTLKVEDMEGKTMREEIFGEVKTFNFYKKNAKFNSTAELNKAWGNGNTEINKLKKTEINNAFNTIGSKLKNNYAIRNYRGTAFLKEIKGKKVPDVEKFDANIQKAKTILTSLKANELADQQLADMQPIMEFYEKQKDNFSDTDKKEKKVVYACYSNLAAFHYIFGDMDAAAKYNEEAAKIDFRNAGTKSMAETIQTAKARMDKNGVTTRHFVVDPSAAEGPEGADYSHLSEFPQPVVMEAVDNTVVFPGTFVTDQGKTMTGDFVFKSGVHGEPRFYLNGDVMFHWEENGQPREWVISDNFKSLEFNGRKFMFGQYKEPLSLNKSDFVFESIIADGKMKLYKSYPLERDDDNDPEIVIGTPDGKNIPLMITNPRFVNWKKGFGGLFEDCAALNADILAGNYKRDLAEVKRAIKAYNTGNCK